MITRRKCEILKANANYYTTNRALLQDALGETNDRVMRKVLLQLQMDGMLNVTRMEVINPDAAEGPAKVYYPSRKGLEFLAAETGDETWMEKCCLTPNWQHLLHWTTVARFHVRLDQATARQSKASIGGWYGEWDVIDAKATTPKQRYRLYTEITEKPKLVCAPDAAFQLCVGPHKKTHYVEIDRETTAVNGIAASKTPGYAALAERQLHRRHFETTSESFIVLSVSPSEGRRKLVMNAIRGKPGAHLWRFACWPQLTSETLLYESIWHRVDGEPMSLVKRDDVVVSAANRGSVEGPEGVTGRTGSGPGTVKEAV